MSKRKRIVAILAALAVLIGGGSYAIAATIAAAPLPVGQYADGTYLACVQTASPYAVRSHPGAKTASCPSGYRLLTLNTKGATGPKGATGAKGAAGIQGPSGVQGIPGPKGDSGSTGAKGDDAVLSMTASTSVTDRNDSGVAGNWAKDTFTRTVTISRNSAVDAAKCGATASKCWFYTGKISDLGTFATIAGAKTPNDGALTIAGQLSGAFSGGTEIEFFSSDSTPNASGVVTATAGNAIATSDWYKQFFSAGTTYGSNDALLNWGWSYGPTSTCESWINAKGGNVGNITGVNACPVP